MFFKNRSVPKAAIVKPPKMPPVDEKQVHSLLKKYDCPVPYREVRTRFLGNIATPAMTASPMHIVKGLWGGELPEFENMDAVNDLIGALINGLWNSLTRHQKRTEPFRLIRTPVEQTRAGLAAYILMRRQEIDGFVEALFNGQDDIDLPEKAGGSLDIIAQLRAMLAGAYTLVTEETKPGSDAEFARTMKNIQQLTPMIEREINTVVIACTVARRQMLKNQDFPEPSFH
jgi:hypothetical protein